VTRATTSPAAIDAFKRAVVADYSGAPSYPNGAVVLPAGLGREAFNKAMQDRDPRTTPLVFVCDDGSQLICTPHGLRERR